MRRKSTRNAQKATPDKTKDTETPPKTRRSRRKKRSPSRSSDSDEEVLTVTKRAPLEETPDTTTKSHTPSDEEGGEEPVWKVTPTESSPKGEIQKLKICLTKSSPDSPEKKRRTKSGSQNDDDITEDKSSRRTRSQGSPLVRNEMPSQDADEDVEEKRGKGKSKGKHKSKLEKTPQLSESETRVNNEISGNAQVTPQSPSIDKRVDVDNKSECKADDLQSEELTADDAQSKDSDDDQPLSIIKTSTDKKIDDETSDSRDNTMDAPSDKEETKEDEKSSVETVSEKEKVLESAIQPEEKIDDSSKEPEEKLDSAKQSEEPIEQDKVCDSSKEPEEKCESEKPPEEPMEQVSVETLEEKIETEKASSPQTHTQNEDTELSQTQTQNEESESSQTQAQIEEPEEAKNEVKISSPQVEISEKDDESLPPPLELKEKENHISVQNPELEENAPKAKTEMASPKVEPKHSETLQENEGHFKLRRDFVLNEQTEANPTPLRPSKIERKWQSDLTSTLKVDLEVIQSVFPTIEFPEEPDLHLDIEKERKKAERKVSVEYKSDSERAFERQTSANSASEDDNSNIIAFNRKISIVDDTASKLRPPPSPAKNPTSAILFITNLVRPFTVKQLRELLERTGKIKEEGFWTDRIKSKCFVNYESQEEAEATRNALHGVQWPIGNGKKLIIDYATEEEMEKAKNPPAPPPAEVLVAAKENVEPVEEKKEEKVTDFEKKRAEGPIREWDIGKKDIRRERSRSRERGRKHRRTPTPDFIAKKQRKAEEPAPQKLMDDLFLKTKATPSIYWQPLSPTEIAMKEQQRQLRMEEHKRRMESSRMKGRDGGRGGFRRRYD